MCGAWVVLYLHSTSNHNKKRTQKIAKIVVLYLHSTSNHNKEPGVLMCIYVVLYLHSTSNHNQRHNLQKGLIGCIISSFYIKPQLSFGRNGKPRTLYYIFILHQTTTRKPVLPVNNCCIISSFYIKPQLVITPSFISACCIISSFYIKPQPVFPTDVTLMRCIISSFYIKPQQQPSSTKKQASCIISSFYIKPQLLCNVLLSYLVVLYLHSTSNHNVYAVADNYL